MPKHKKAPSLTRLFGEVFILFFNEWRMTKHILATLVLDEVPPGKSSRGFARKLHSLGRLRLSLGGPSRGELIGCLTGILLFGWAIPAQGQRLPISPDDLVGKVVANGLKAADAPGYSMFRIHEQSPHSSTTREVIETKDWLIGRVIQRNGKPLTPDQRRKEDEHLTRLLTDSQALQKEREKQQKDERRVRDLFKALPQAFSYEYAERLDGEDSAQLVRLKFHPKPSFSPPTAELRVLTGMEGTLTVDVTASRIARVDARLVKKVNFGWGILAHLDPGGTFLLEQRNVGSGRWELTKLALHFTGKIFLFKRLEIDSVRTASDFRIMPDNLTLKDGLELLKSDLLEPRSE
jgi:hypothetical protein